MLILIRSIEVFVTSAIIFLMPATVLYVDKRSRDLAEKLLTFTTALTAFWVCAGIDRLLPTLARVRNAMQRHIV